MIECQDCYDNTRSRCAVHGPLAPDLLAENARLAEELRKIRLTPEHLINKQKADAAMGEMRLAEEECTRLRSTRESLKEALELAVTWLSGVHKGDWFRADIVDKCRSALAKAEEKP